MFPPLFAVLFQVTEGSGKIKRAQRHLRTVSYWLGTGQRFGL